MIHLAAQVAPGIDVVFLDTGYHFAETIGTRDAVGAVHDVNVITSPRADRRRAGRRPRARTCSPATPTCAARCARSRRWTRRLTAYAAWASGLRRDDSPARANTPVVAWDAKRQEVKVAPIARWTHDDVDAYVAEHG